ncbi:MAG: pantoate--beta-alanine ligase [Alphaproteobacteria bacterium]
MTRAPALPIVRTVGELRDKVASWRRRGRSVALVPTMGALHEGHMSLVRLGLATCDRVVATLFVNPKQFGAADDLARYPRDEALDAALLEDAGARLLFAPTVETMYPTGFATTVAVHGLTEVLCGAHRPGYFAGVATVVTKLLLQALPDVAVFGEKDYQQLVVVRRLVRDLNVPVRIVAGPTVREADGLALSSRNAYLTADERKAAPALHATLAAFARRLAAGEDAEPIAAWAREALIEAGFRVVDYVEARGAHDLEPVERWRRGRDIRVFGAAWLGSARLIDNVPVEALVET